jgi:hypothetical protein
MSSEGEKNMTTEAPAAPPPALEEEKPLVGYSEDADDDVPPGWLVISEGEQIVVPHPEGQKKEEIVEAFFNAKKKNQSAFQIGLYVFDTSEVTTFGWSEDIHFPEMEKFDNLQERMEGLADAMTGLTHQAAALQQAHAELIQSELAMGDEEDDEDDTDAGGPIAPEVLDAAAPVPPARPVQPRAKTFRPPGA